MKNRVKITIDGKNFTLVGEETEEHMREVAAYIDKKMTEVRQKAAVVALDASLAYVLTSINVADDYFKEKAYCAELEGRLLGMTARAKELSEKLAAKEAEIAAKEAEQGVIPAEKEKPELKDLEDRLAFSEKAREAAENKLDSYMMAMEGSQQGGQKHTAKAKSGKR